VLQERETRLLEDLAVYPPPYLLAELGQPPTNRDGRAAWLRGAHAIERHRAAYDIFDREQAFGDGDHRTASARGKSWTTLAARSPRAPPVSCRRGSPCRASRMTQGSPSGRDRASGSRR
jgi:hypothetical protein